jgi:hypothetical protein
MNNNKYEVIIISERKETSSFVLTLSLNTEKWQEDLLNKKLEIGRKIYNACLGKLIKRVEAMRERKLFRKALKTDDKKERSVIFKKLRDDLKISEYEAHKLITPMKRHFDGVLDINTAQKIATRAYHTVEKYMYDKKTKKVNFKKFGIFNSLEGKSNSFGLKYRDKNNVKYISWGKLEIPVIVRKNDIYAQETLSANKVKYVRILKKNDKFYAQLIMEGIPPAKRNKEDGTFKNKEISGNVGLDIGTSTIAISSSKEVKLLELAPKDNIELNREKARLQRKLDRSRRATNPDNYSEDGTIKKGFNKWIKSKNYNKVLYEHKQLSLKQTRYRREEHNKLANYILELGDNIFVETMNFKALQKRSKKTEISKKTGKFKKKKRFGKSILNKAPSMLLTILDIKLKYRKQKLHKINTFKIKASQYNHIEDEYIKKSLSKRWNDLNGNRIQRDLYSAFLIQHTNKDLESLNVEEINNNYSKFKELHDIEIDRIRSTEGKKLKSLGV